MTNRVVIFSLIAHGNEDLRYPMHKHKYTDEWKIGHGFKKKEFETIEKDGRNKIDNITI